MVLNYESLKKTSYFVKIWEFMNKKYSKFKINQIICLNTIHRK